MPPHSSNNNNNNNNTDATTFERNHRPGTALYFLVQILNYALKKDSWRKADWRDVKGRKAD